MRSKTVGIVILLITLLSGVCCFEGALFGHFSAVAMASSSVMVAVWIAGLIYFAREYKGAPIQKNLLTILLAAALLAEIWMLFSGNEGNAVKIMFLPLLFVLCGFAELIKDSFGISELGVYTGLTVLFLIVNVTACLWYSEPGKTEQGDLR